VEQVRARILARKERKPAVQLDPKDRIELRKEKEEQEKKERREARIKAKIEAKSVLNDEEVWEQMGFGGFGSSKKK
jgi:U4/U6.U5 tri-snRNP component SNU23